MPRPDACALPLRTLAPSAVVAGLCVLIELSTWLATGGPLAAIHVCAVLDATALALLGPGAYSLDARLSGRRQIFLAPRNGPRDE